MTYDNTDTNADGAIDAPVDNDSVSTEEVSASKAFTLDFSENNPHVERSQEIDSAWAIKPSNANSNPVYDGSQVTDISAVGVADPFVRWVDEDGQFHAMFEALDSGENGDIAHYEGPTLTDLSYTGLAYNPSSHASWGNFFKWQGTWYMVPGISGEFRILEQGSSWTDWSLVETPLTRTSLNDIAPFRYNGRWYFLARLSGTGTVLYYADQGESLTGRTWTEHPDSPILTETADDVEGICGKPIVRDGRIVDFPTQTEDAPRGIRAWRLTGLTTSSSTVTELPSSPLLRPQGNGWDGDNVHHCDIVTGGPLSSPKALIDGRGTGNWRVGVYDVGEKVAPTTIVGLGSNETISTAWDKLNNLNDIRRDPLGLYDASTQEWTVPADGDYRVSVTYRYVSSDSTANFLAMIRNETTTTDNIVCSVSGAAGGSYTMFGNSVELADLSEGDVLSAYGGQSTGAGVDLNSPDTVVTFERLR